MKVFFKKIVLTLMLIGCVLAAYAQGMADNLGSALGNGNVGGVSKYFDNAVSMSVVSSPSTYSRSQAEMVLRDFFSKNAAKGFVLEHSGGSNGSSYAIGTLQTANGKYRAYISVRQKDGGYVVQEIRIER
jgi:hypothetical protein